MFRVGGSGGVAELLLGVWRLWSFFSFGGHRNVEQTTDRHHAEERVRYILQHLFLPTTRLSFVVLGGALVGEIVARGR
jgi:hypothetical protein